MLLEFLESRSFLSASTLTAPIATDEAHVQSALANFRSDADTSMAKMLADEATMRAATIKKNPLLAPLFAAFGQEVKVVGTAVNSNNLINLPTLRADTSAVTTDLKQYAADHGNASAQSADLAHLHADRAQLEKDEIGQVDAELAAMETHMTALTDAANSLAEKVENSKMVTHVTEVDINKFLTDHTSGFSSALGQLNVLSTARTQLAAALSADVNASA